jgi:hypothetical protein
VVLGVVCAAAGCTSYYRVHDPTTGKDYYTTDVKQERGGAATLKDAKTGRQVTVQNSEVEKVSEEKYKQGLYAQPSQMPANMSTPSQPQSSAPPSGQPADANKTASGSSNPF